MDIETHPFEPFLPEGARILFLGSFPPQPHRWSMPFYYPNWINDFWRIMGLLHFGDKDHFCIPAEKRFDEAAIRALHRPISPRCSPAFPVATPSLPPARKPVPSWRTPSAAECRPWAAAST